MSNKQLSFIPGPAKISEQTYADIHHALESSFLEESHRGEKFSDISHACLKKLRKFLEIPSEYKVFYLSSATDAWHSIVANTVSENCFNVVQGAFSAKAKRAAEHLYKNVSSCEVVMGKQCEASSLEVPDDAEVISLCLNESSTGVRLSIDELRTIREQYQEPLLAVDVTSCAGAIRLPIEEADIWYFSVQKAFGLPAGLGVLIASPRAYQRSLKLDSKKHNLGGVWRWSNQLAMQEKHPGHTQQTPNMFAIYLLERQLTRFLDKGLSTISAETTRKAQEITQAVTQHNSLSMFVKKPIHRSETVLVVEGSPEDISALQKKAAKNNITLGVGYGPLKNTTIRVGNFPAHNQSDIDRLISIF